MITGSSSEEFKLLIRGQVIKDKIKGVALLEEVVSDGHHCERLFLGEALLGHIMERWKLKALRQFSLQFVASSSHDEEAVRENEVRFFASCGEEERTRR